MKQKFKIRFNREWLTYLVFLLIAIVIWYLNALNKNYTTTMNFKVRYVNLPADKVLVNTPLEKLSLTINASGYTILKERLGFAFQPIAIDAGHRNLRAKTSNPSIYYILTKNIYTQIEQEFDASISLKSISPDTISFVFSEVVQKEIPVKVLVDLQFEKQYLPKGQMKINPAKVTIAGPRAIVDTMKYVYTQPIKYRKLNDTLRADIKLQPVRQLKYSVEEVHIVQPIERHTEATLSVPIEVINLTDGLKMKTFPGVVTINCMVGISDFEKLQPYLFRVAVDYASIKDSKDNQARVKVSLLKSPDYVSDVKFNPKNVEYIVEK